LSALFGGTPAYRFTISRRMAVARSTASPDAGSTFGNLVHSLANESAFCPSWQLMHDPVVEELGMNRRRRFLVSLATRHPFSTNSSECPCRSISAPRSFSQNELVAVWPGEKSTPCSAMYPAESRPIPIAVSQRACFLRMAGTPPGEMGKRIIVLVGALCGPGQLYGIYENGIGIPALNGCGPPVFRYSPMLPALPLAAAMGPANAPPTIGKLASAPKPRG